MRKIESIFKKMLPVVRDALNNEVDNNGNIPKIGRNPKFSDVNLITLSLSAEFLSMDSENRLFDLIRKSPFFQSMGLIDRTSYHRRRKLLYPTFNKVLESVSSKIAPDEDAFIVDSIPVEICRFARAKRAKICKEHFETSPEFGYCAAQRTTFFGYKLHALCGINGVFRNIDLSKGNIADIHYLQDIRQYLSHCKILGDKAYLSAEIQQDLFETQHIQLYTPNRSNQPDYKKYPVIFRKLRKRIETLFSQLCDQFMLKRNYAKSFIGVATRVISKIVSLTVAQYFNKFVTNRPLNEIKYAFSN